MKYHIGIALNEGNHFEPFSYGDRLRIAAGLIVEGGSPEAALEEAWQVANKMGADSTGFRYPAQTERSASVGDVFIVHSLNGYLEFVGAYAAESVGFVKLQDKAAVEEAIGGPIPTA